MFLILLIFNGGPTVLSENRTFNQKLAELKAQAPQTEE